MYKLVHFLILLFLFSFNLLLPQVTSHETAQARLVIWNVGQGQWATWVLPDQSICLHSDFGGEISPIQKIKAHCEKYQNIFILSHFDLDHRSFASDIQKQLPTYCISQLSISPPQSSQLSSRQNKALEQFKRWKKCESTLAWKKIAGHLQVHQQSETLDETNNNKSLAVYFKRLLTTGDLTSKKETATLHQFDPNKIKWWLLGHHGSKTSNSIKSIEALPALQMVFASSRYAKYKHPHPTVLARFKLKKIPLLRTEEWGNIHIELRKNYFTSSVELD